MNSFDTSSMFVGGAGFFLQYHDVIKPAYLYALVKMIINNDTHGLPFELISSLSLNSLIEWYRNRKYINPLKQLDYQSILDESLLDNFLSDYMKNDAGIYTMAPMLNFGRMLSVYRTQYMMFPIYVYSEKEDPNILIDCRRIFEGIPFTYIFGDIKDCVKKVGQNFTYIFSDIELFKETCYELNKTYSNILIAGDYRYNYLDGHKTFKYELKELMLKNFPIRTGEVSVYDGLDYSRTFSNIIQGGT